MKPFSCIGCICDIVKVEMRQFQSIKGLVFFISVKYTIYKYCKTSGWIIKCAALLHFYLRGFFFCPIIK